MNEQCTPFWVYSYDEVLSLFGCQYEPKQDGGHTTTHQAASLYIFYARLKCNLLEQSETYSRRNRKSGRGML